MSQTERSNAAIVAMLADNSSGGISPTDLRDALASLMGYGSLVLDASSDPATMSGVGMAYSLVDVYDTIGAQSSDVNTLGTIATLSPTWRFTFGSTGIYNVSFFASFSSSANNVLVTFRQHVSGSPGIVEADRFLATGSDTGVVAFGIPLPYSAGEYVDVRVKLDTGSANLTFLCAGFGAFRVG